MIIVYILFLIILPNISKLQITKFAYVLFDTSKCHFCGKVPKDFLIESSHDEKKNNERIAYHVY